MNRSYRVALLVEAARGSARAECRGVSDFARERGDWPVVLQENVLQSGLESWLKNWNGDGILAWIEDAATADALHRLRLPMVDVLGKLKRPGIPMVGTDTRALAQMAVDFFLQNGFRHFAFCGYPGLYFSDERCAAWNACLQTKSFASAVFTPPRDGRQGADMLSRESTGMRELDLMAGWLKKHPQPLALLACNDVRAQQVLAACRAHGIEAPGRVAVMDVDNDELLCELSAPRLTSIEPDLVQIGYRGAEILDRMMRGQKVEDVRMELPPAGIMERNSTAMVTASDPVVRQAVKFIREQVCRGITVKDVVEHVGRSRTNLDALFQQHLNTTVSCLILQQRLAAVKRLLQETKLPQVEIARQTGFANAQHMSRVFKQKLGHTPDAFRKRRR